PAIVTNIFSNHSPDQIVGQDIWAGGHVYKILGVLQPLGKFFGISRDNRIYVPFATYKKNFGLNVARGAFTGSGTIVAFVQTQTAPQLVAAEVQVWVIMSNRRWKSLHDGVVGY